MGGEPDDNERRRLGLDAPITRRDFVNGALVGAGSALLSTSFTAAAAKKSHAAPKTKGSKTPDATDRFTGYGGVGDYARSNGNTWPVVQAAHRIRDGVYDAAALAAAKPAGEFDLVVASPG